MILIPSSHAFLTSLFCTELTNSPYLIVEPFMAFLNPSHALNESEQIGFSQTWFFILQFLQEAQRILCISPWSLWVIRFETFLPQNCQMKRALFPQNITKSVTCHGCHQNGPERFLKLQHSPFTPIFGPHKVQTAIKATRFYTPDAMLALQCTYSKNVCNLISILPFHIIL